MDQALTEQIVGPVAIASALRQAIPGAGYSTSDIVAALRATGVYSDLSPVQIVAVLRAPQVFPALTRTELSATLAAAGILAQAAREAIDAILGAPPALRLVQAQASSQLSASYNGRPQTAERLLEGPHPRTHFWNSDPALGGQSAWFWVRLQQPARVSGLTLAWGSARAMRYRVLRSLDGASWTPTGVDQSHAPGLASTQREDHLPGWEAPTQFVRLAMEQSAGNYGYFTCRYVLVHGEWV